MLRMKYCRARACFRFKTSQPTSCIILSQIDIMRLVSVETHRAFRYGKSVARESRVIARFNQVLKIINRMETAAHDLCMAFGKY